MEEFERYSVAGYIDVASVAPATADFYSPDRVMDLTVVETLYSESSVVLEWTAVGDDYNIGNG